MGKNNIEKELKRIKSLFTEDRLYGNLVNEQLTNPDTNGNFVIDATEFAASGDEITADEAKLFVNTYHNQNPTEDKVMNFCFKQPVISKAAEEYNASFNETTFKKSVTSSGGVCEFTVSNKGSIAGVIAKVNKLDFWANKWITFFVEFPDTINLSNKVEFKKSFDWTTAVPGSVILRVKGNEDLGVTEKIKWMKFEGRINEAVTTYNNLKFMGFYDDKGKSKNIPTLEKYIEEQKYKPGGTEWGNFDGILSNLGISESGNITDIINNMTS